MLLEKAAHDHGFFHAVSSMVLMFDAVVKGPRRNRVAMRLIVGKTEKINPRKALRSQSGGGQDRSDGHIIILCKSPSEALGCYECARNINTHENSGS